MRAPGSVSTGVFASPGGPWFRVCRAAAMMAAFKFLLRRGKALPPRNPLSIC
jgi:hypothetical protein